MRVIYSNTSSKGNATVIQSDSGELLCVDAGLPYSKVNKAIGYKLHECKCVLLTHQHSDHTSHAKEYQKRGMLIFASGETGEACDFQGLWSSFYKQAFDVPGFKVKPFELIHNNSDGSDCPCYGFLIRDESNGELLLHATDTQYIEQRFPACDIYCLEANYWEQDDYSDDLEAIEKVVEQRRVRSHMSINTMVGFLEKQDLSKCREIRLLHMSESMTGAEKASIIPYIQSELQREDLNIVLE